MARIVCFDFDETLCYTDGTPNHVMIAKLHAHAEAGDICHVVTARSGRNESQEARDRLYPGMVAVRDFIEAYKLPIAQVFFANHNPKGPLLQRLGAVLFYDDSPDELASAREHGIEAVDSVPLR
jgi:hypothetical protein